MEQCWISHASGRRLNNFISTFLFLQGSLDDVMWGTTVIFILWRLDHDLLFFIWSWSVINSLSTHNQRETSACQAMAFSLRFRDSCRCILTLKYDSWGVVIDGSSRRQRPSGVKCHSVSLLLNSAAGSVVSPWIGADKCRRNGFPCAPPTSPPSYQLWHPLHVFLWDADPKYSHHQNPLTMLILRRSRIGLWGVECALSPDM